MSGDSSPFVVRRPGGLYSLPGRGSPWFRLTLELTERCDNACVHCYINRPAGDPDAIARELSTQRVKEILDEAAALGTWIVRFTGGEPLLRTDFDELFVHARKLGMRVILSTNARGITPDRADLFARMPPLEPIEVTVYGMRKETYEGNSRAPGSWAEFRRGVDLLLERRIPFVVKAVLLPSFEKEREEFEAWAKTIPSMPGPPSYTKELDLRARRDDEEASRRIRALRTARAGSPGPGAERPESAKETAGFCEDFFGPAGDRLFQCGAGRKCAVDAYGTLQPCLLLRHPDACVDVRTSSLQEAGAEMRNRLGGLKAEDQGYLDRCARCFLRSLCQQCPAKSWMESGTLDTPTEYLCQVTHAEARRLGLLKEDEFSWNVSDWWDRVKSRFGSSSKGDQRLGGTPPATTEGDGDGRQEEVGKA